MVQQCSLDAGISAAVLVQRVANAWYDIDEAMVQNLFLKYAVFKTLGDTKDDELWGSINNKEDSDTATEERVSL